MDNVIEKYLSNKENANSELGRAIETLTNERGNGIAETKQYIEDQIELCTKENMDGKDYISVEDIYDILYSI